MQYIREIEKQKEKLDKIKKICNEIMLEFCYIDSIILAAGKKTVDEAMLDDDKLTQELSEQCFKAYQQFIIKKTESSSSTEILKLWLERVENEIYCYQGGVGYYIHTSLKSLPSHWVVREEYYDIVNPTIYEEIAFLIEEKKYYLASKSEWQIWEN